MIPMWIIVPLAFIGGLTVVFAVANIVMWFADANDRARVATERAVEAERLQGVLQRRAEAAEAKVAERDGAYR